MSVRKRIWYKPHPAMSRYAVLLKRRIGWRMMYIDDLGQLHSGWSLWRPVHEPREMRRRQSIGF